MTDTRDPVESGLDSIRFSALINILYKNCSCFLSSCNLNLVGTISRWEEEVCHVLCHSSCRTNKMQNFVVLKLINSW